MSATPQARPTGHKGLEEYVGLRRSALQSHLRSAKMNPPGGVGRPPLHAFDTSDIWPWIANWLKATFQTDIESLVVPQDKKHAFEAYPDSGDRGHYDLSGFAAPDGSIRFAMAGDWATGTDVAQQVADSMVRNNPELTIHLGDIYYVGTAPEVEQNCLGADTPNYKGVLWPKGSKGSFAMNGNHEMYSGGNGYFDDFIPHLGIPTSRDQRQLRSYFCLETARWRIVAIDTGYNADTLSGDCHLEQILLDWLKNVIDPVHNRKPTIILSHHQWFSGFGDGDYPKPGTQIAPFFQNQEIVWLWGHEHRLAIYYKYKDPESHLTAYGRCIGHGGMPIEMPDAKYPNGDREQRVEYWDGLTDLHPNRFRRLSDGTLVATNGYADMTIQDSTLTLEYLDADGNSVLKESFEPGGGASWEGTLIRTVVSDPHILGQIIYE
jgi:hypothetical protein